MNSQISCLLVDDHAGVAQSYVRGLQLRYVRVQFRETADKAVAFMASGPSPDVLVLDLRMPPATGQTLPSDETGIHLYREFRRSGFQNPVIFLTNVDEIDEKMRALMAQDRRLGYCQKFETTPNKLLQEITRLSNIPN